MQDLAEELQDRWMRGENTRRLEFALGVMIEQI